MRILLILSLLCLSVYSYAWADPLYGEASYYTNVETKYRSCADGKFHDLDRELVCASWFYDFGTRLVISSGSIRIVVVVVDRGPAKRLVKKGRIIDLSARAFKALDGGKLDRGILQVKIERLGAI